MTSHVLVIGLRPNQHISELAHEFRETSKANAAHKHFSNILYTKLTHEEIHSSIGGCLLRSHSKEEKKMLCVVLK